MRKTVSVRGILVVALLLAGNATAGTVTIFNNFDIASNSNPSPAGSINLGPDGAVGGIGGPIGFSLPSAGLFTLTVLDCCLVGDVYQAFIDGVSQGLTPVEPLLGSTLSSGSFSEQLSAGPHTYDINDVLISYVGFADPYGGGIVTSGFAAAGVTDTGTLSSVPEPATFVLLGVALLGVAGIKRRRAA